MKEDVWVPTLDESHLLTMDESAMASFAGALLVVIHSTDGRFRIS